MPGLQLPDWPSCLLPLMIIAHLHPDSYHLFTFADRWCLAAQNVPCTIIPQCNCQLSVQNLWFHQCGLVFTAFTSAEENAHLWLPFTSGRTSPPCHAETPLPPPPTLPHLADTPLTSAASRLSAHSIHNPAGLWLYTLHRLCCLIFSIARCLYNINNPGPDDGNKVQSVEVRRVRAGFDLHNLLQTPAQPSQTHQITWFGEPD